MALLYDSFALRRIDVIANIWPDFDRFLPGALSRLTAELNDDDGFSSIEVQSETGVRLEGEQWVYDLSLSSVMLRCRAVLSPEMVSGRVRSLLDTTRQFFSARHPIAFYTDQIQVLGYVPDDKEERNVGDVVKKRLLARVSAEDQNALPGLAGAGLHLVGNDYERRFHWHASIEPPHGAYDSLGLWSQLIFLPTEGPPTAGPDLDAIEEQIGYGYDLSGK